MEHGKKDGFCADVFFDESMKFIGQKKDEPFFVYLATNVPHGPTAVLKEWLKPYENQDMPGGNAYGSTKEHFATITRFDHNLGRLRQFLAKNNLEDNTILIFLTDNGSARGAGIFNDGMQGSKGALYEGGHRVPCFIHWPQGGLNQGVDIDRFTGHIDLLPTLIDICKLKTSARGHLDFDGRSLVPLLKDKTSAWADRLVVKHVQNTVEFPVKGLDYLIATEKWRLINGGELYDIQADPGQHNNIATQHPDVVNDLTKKYDDYWDGLKIEDRPYPRPIIGSGHDEETILTSFDWILDRPSPFTHRQVDVLAGANNSDFWPVEIAADGLYQFDIRRWPREINHPICAALPEQKTSDVFLLNKPIKLGKGKAIPVAKIRLDAGNRKVEKTISSSDVNAVFQMRLKAGNDTMRAWLIDAQGNEQGAYCVYVRRLPYQ
jgi:arylsulfatase B